MIHNYLVLDLETNKEHILEVSDEALQELSFDIGTVFTSYGTCDCRKYSHIIEPKEQTFRVLQEVDGTAISGQAVKKALRACANKDCNGCPYQGRTMKVRCTEALLVNALSYVQRLEDRLNDIRKSS